MPFNMPRKCAEVFGLELYDDGLGEVGLLGEGWGLAGVVRAMAELFTHETVAVMSIEWLLGDMLIPLKISCPG